MPHAFWRRGLKQALAAASASTARVLVAPRADVVRCSATGTLGRSSNDNSEANDGMHCGAVWHKAWNAPKRNAGQLVIERKLDAGQTESRIYGFPASEARIAIVERRGFALMSLIMASMRLTHISVSASSAPCASS